MMLKNDTFSLFSQYLLNQNDILNYNFFYWKFDIQGFNMDTKFAEFGFKISATWSQDNNVRKLEF